MPQPRQPKKAAAQALAEPRPQTQAEPVADPDANTLPQGEDVPPTPGAKPHVEPTATELEGADDDLDVSLDDLPDEPAASHEYPPAEPTGDEPEPADEPSADQHLELAESKPAPGDYQPPSVSEHDFVPILDVAFAAGHTLAQHQPARALANLAASALERAGVELRDADLVVIVTPRGSGQSLADALRTVRD